MRIHTSFGVKVVLGDTKSQLSKYLSAFQFLHPKAAESTAILSGQHLLGTCFGDVRICLQEADAICRLSPTLRHY